MMAISLKGARVEANLTQAEAAKRIGVAANTISRWEMGECMPNSKYIPLICEVYGRNYGDIIFLTKNYALSVNEKA